MLADEPTGQLDQTTAAQVLDALLASINGTATALVVATHDVAVSSRMDSVWRMRHGAVVERRLC